ncbi:hypothetical protein HYX07_01575 [Candidatus Woesearchaeota archaeon]|nr:hypothetical protein [Candidatus Woesearchaeota archaeon]
MTIKAPERKPIDQLYASGIISETLTRGGAEVTSTEYRGQIIVDAVDKENRANTLTYIIGKKSIKGPNLSRHQGTSKLDALVQNVDEDLTLIGLSYNPQNGKYEGQFERF